MSKKVMLGRFLTSTMLTGVAATVATPVFAQDEEGDSDDRIVVTGSRIARQDLAAPSPLTTVDGASLQITNTVNTEDYLNDLPQLIPSFDSTSNNPGDGTARLSLRGLGANRTLILLDGKRMVTEGISQVVDLNNIPAALVERIEVVTGGSSAVYGSDAVAGVVNYILKDDFEGAEVNASYRLTGKGDAQTLNLSAVLGGNFADDKGNAVMAISYTDRKPLLQGERDFSSLTLFDQGPGVPFSTSGSSSIPEGRFRGASSSSFGGLAPACPPGNTCSGAIVPSPAGIAPFRLGTPTDPANDFYNYAPTNYLQLPQERYNISAFATYEILDGVEAYARGIFSHVLVDSQLAPTPVVSEGPGSGPLSRASIVAAPLASRAALARQSGFLLVETNNPFLSGGTASPAGLALGALIFGAGNASGLIGDTNGNGFSEYLVRVRKRFEEVGPRNSLRDTNTFLVGGGLRGDLGENDQWKWDVYGQYGRSAVNLTQTGNVSRGALFDAVFAGTLNLFDGPGSIQADQAALIARTGAISQITENVQILGTISGETGIQAPWANRAVAVAAGIEYREEASLQQPDSVLGPDVAGFNQSVFVQGRYDVYEAFGEVDIPLISDVPLIQDFSINGAYRYSDYSTVGNVSSFAVGGSWQMIDDIRFRAQFQRAVRAPNISELFIAPANGFPGVADPCDGVVFGNFGFLSAAQQAAVTPNCVADGVPLADVGGFISNNGQTETVFAGFGSDLEAEKADTLTIGAVFTPTFMPGFTMTVDYYDIKIDNAIGAPTAQSIVEDCILRAIAAACALTSRDAAGELLIIGDVVSGAPSPVLVQNNVGLFVRGIDVGFSYRFDLPGDAGSFALRFDGTHTLENSNQGSALSALTDCAGFYGSSCGEPTPEWKFSTLGTWTWGALSTSLRYSWISGVDDAFSIAYDAYAGQRLVPSIGSFGTLDLSLNYDVNEMVQVQFGIDNITGKEPPQLGSCCSEQANTWPATYETLGRQFFAGATLRF